MCCFRLFDRHGKQGSKISLRALRQLPGIREASIIVAQPFTLNVAIKCVVEFAALVSIPVVLGRGFPELVRFSHRVFLRNSQDAREIFSFSPTL